MTTSRSEAWATIRSVLGALRSDCLQYLAVSSPSYAVDVLRLRERMQPAQTLIPPLLAAPNIAQYAFDEVGTAGFNIVTRVQAIVAAIRDLEGDIDANIPQDGSGYLLITKLGANGTIQQRPLTAGHKAAMAARVQAIVDAIF